MSTSPDQFRMTLSWADPETGTELLECLATADSEDVSISVDCLSRNTVSPCIEVEPVTRKQREAVRLAVKKGYYKNPREASLADVAGPLGISESAVSQRLATVERKLMIALAATCE